MGVKKWEIISFFCGVLFGGYGIAKICENAMKKEERRADKNNINFKTSCKWIKVYQDNKKIEDYLDRESIKEVAIYGVGELGKCLLKDLENTDISVKYLIDRNSYRAFRSYLCYSPLDDLPEVQAVIVTPVSDFEKIAEQLKKKIRTRVIPLNQMIEEL